MESARVDSTGRQLYPWEVSSEPSDGGSVVEESLRDATAAAVEPAADVDVEVLGGCDDCDLCEGCDEGCCRVTTKDSK